MPQHYNGGHSIEMFGDAAFLYLVALVLGVIGWVMNLIAAVGVFVYDQPVTTKVLFRLIGIPVAILGAVLGWF